MSKGEFILAMILAVLIGLGASYITGSLAPQSMKLEYRLEIVNDSTAIINGYDNSFDTIPFKYIQEYIIKDNP